LNSPNFLVNPLIFTISKLIPPKTFLAYYFDVLLYKKRLPI
jgi:hypothetical protein